ncbi:MAG: hypothetical protein K5769_06200 [Pseudobutyrivibrio sp.]|nr:hypothetical protein [Pseudobutyrivibrio sp.]
MNIKNLKSAGVAALTAAVVLSGCGKIDPKATLVTINPGDGTKDTISLGYGNFVARYRQSMSDMMFLGYYGEDMWQSDQMSADGTTLQETTKKSVLDTIEEHYIAKSHAKDYGVEISKEQSKEISDAAKKFMKDNSKDTLKALGAKEEYVQRYLEDSTYYKLVSDAAKKEADKDIKDEECDMRTFSYVLFDTTGTADESGAAVEYTEEEIAGFKQQAEALSASSDFAKDAEAIEKTAQTYSYLRGEKEDDQMDMKIIKEAEKLSEGDISPVIEVEGVGYYVIKLDSDHDDEASQQKREQIQGEKFQDLMAKWKETVVWKVDEKQWEKVQFDSLFKAPEKEDAAEESTEDTTKETTDEATEEQTEDKESSDESTDNTEENSEENTEATEDSETE